MAGMNKLRVAQSRCNQCLFGPNKIVTDAAKADIIEGCLKRDQHFECHKGTIAGEQLVCRGFWDAHRLNVWPLRLVQMEEMFEFVEIPNAPIG